VHNTISVNSADGTCNSARTLRRHVISSVTCVMVGSVHPPRICCWHHHHHHHHRSHAPAMTSIPSYFGSRRCLHRKRHHWVSLCRRVLCYWSKDHTGPCQGGAITSGKTTNDPVQTTVSHRPCIAPFDPFMAQNESHPSIHRTRNILSPVEVDDSILGRLDPSFLPIDKFR